MLEERLYCMDPEVAELAEKAEKLSIEISKLEHELTNMALYAVDELNEEWIKRINSVMGEATAIDIHATALERNLNHLTNKRTKWKRIPPFRFWKKGS